MEIKPPAVVIRHASNVKGRGVFASKEFVAGEVVEVCPVVLVSLDDVRALPDQLKRLHFDWAALLDSACKDGEQAFAEGYGGLYNHSDCANLRYSADAARQALVFTAVRDVAVEEELTINYNAIGGGPTSQSNRWFDARRLKKETS